MASSLASQSLYQYIIGKLSKTLLRVSYFILLTWLVSCSSGKYISRQADQILLSDSNLTSAHVGISIYDASANKYLYNHDGDKYFIPASNTKLFTCYAAMKHLGDSLVGARVFNNDGHLYIFPNGDPTFLKREFPYQPLHNYLNASNVISVTIVDDVWKENPLGLGWAWDDYNDADMAERSVFPVSGNLFSITGQNGKITSVPTIPYQFSLTISAGNEGFLSNIIREKDKNNFTVEFGSKVKRTFSIPIYTLNGLVNKKILSDTLKKEVFPMDDFVPAYKNDPAVKVIHSQPTDSLLKPMMHRSDNFFAEQTLLMLSNEMTGVMNDETIIDSLLRSDFKDLPQKPRWVDGSGLSRYNLFSPQDMVTVLKKMKTDFGWKRITTILATGGEGTITNYYIDLKNRIFAKTGTLSNNVALSGFLLTKHNKTIIFSVLVNNHMGNTTRIRKAVEKFLTAIAEKY
jgi:serine-type D-Ala-D-Ala carboxypeptidase/endopeptidase (penicillin-binding protein 4)